MHFFRLLTSRSGALKTARLCLGCLINVLIISCSLPSPMPADYMQIRWRPLLGVLPSEPLVLGLGLAMLLVSIGCLLEHMAATMPLLLRAAWAARGVDFNISSVFPLAISVQVSDELKAP